MDNPINCGHAYTMLLEAKKLVMQSYPPAEDWVFIEHDNDQIMSVYKMNDEFSPHLFYNAQFVLEVSLDELVESLMQLANLMFVESVPEIHRFPINEDVQH